MTDPTPAPDDEALVQLGTDLRSRLSARQTMQFELQLGVSMEEVDSTVIGQLVFLVWASRVNTDEPASVDELLELPVDTLTDLAQELVRSQGKATGVEQPVPTPTTSSASSSRSSASRTGSRSTSSSGTPGHS